MRVVHIGEGEDATRWDAYVGPRTAVAIDLFAWRLVVRDAYGLRSHFLAATEGAHIVGTLGLFEIEHPLFGHYLTTAVFGNDGGFHFDDFRARDALVASARTLADRLNVSYLVIRTRGYALDGFHVDSDYRAAVLDLEGGAEAVFARLPVKTRNQVRRGMKEGFSLETGHGQLGSFFDVFHEHMRDLGSPAHSRRFYESIVEHLGERADFLVVRGGKELVAGALLFWTNGTAMNLHTVALRRFNRRCPNYLLYWRMIEASAARGCRWFDMGRSKADGSNLRFKSNWKPQEATLHYNYVLRTLNDVPHLDPRNPKYRAAIAVWRKLPLVVTKTIGPRLISGLG